MNSLSRAAALAVTLLQSAPPSVDSLVEDVRKLASAETNEARFDALTAMLKARNLAFTVEPFTIDKPRGTEPRTEGRNVIVTVGTGTEPLVIGAHYDGARLRDGTLSRGAVDNAASTVMLVRVAEALRADPSSRRVTIVWFDMEELGLIGSDRFMQAHKADRITAMLNFDVNAYGDTILYGPSRREEGAALRRTLVETCAAEARDCLPFPQMPPGDDRPFAKAAIPTLSLAILPAVEAHQVWLLVNGGQTSGLAPGFVPEVLRTIHTPDDTPAKLDGESMLRMFRFTLALVRNVRGKG
jgi:Zn-dependent M28 family amino/carboxypeptidase